ncbi:hypothetical protein ACQJBY_061365 [Aegilops geniculata]
MATPPVASSSPSPSLPLPREGRERKGSGGKGRQRPDPQLHRRAAIPRGRPWRSERDTGLRPCQQDRYVAAPSTYSHSRARMVNHVSLILPHTALANLNACLLMCVCGVYYAFRNPMQSGRFLQIFA